MTSNAVFKHKACNTTMTIDVTDRESIETIVSLTQCVLEYLIKAALMSTGVLNSFYIKYYNIILLHLCVSIIYWYPYFSLSSI